MQSLDATSAGYIVLLYSFLVERKQQNTWELISWRTIQVLPYLEKLQDEIRDNLSKEGICIRKAAHAVECSLSVLLAVAVPGVPRKLNTVFHVAGLIVMGVSSERSEMDEWVLDSCGHYKRFCPYQARFYQTAFCIFSGCLNYMSFSAIYFRLDIICCGSCRCIRMQCLSRLVGSVCHFCGLPLPV